jgi:hypothetical protein
MINMDMRDDATRMETFIELGALVWEHNCKGIFARSKLTLDAIGSMYADFYELPDETRIETFTNSSNQKIMALERSNGMFCSIADHLADLESVGGGYPIGGKPAIGGKPCARECQ